MLSLAGEKMTVQDFLRAIHKHSRLVCWKIIDGDDPKDDHIIIKDVMANSHFRVLVNTVMNTDWQTLEGVLTGKREPRVLRKVTRIVGYFSRVENWNRSKIGELRSRRKGNYSVRRRTRNLGA